MSAIFDVYGQPDISDSMLDPEYDLSDINEMFPTPDCVAMTVEAVEDEAVAVEPQNTGRLPIEKPGTDADQNEWMKVFVPSLLLAGFPKQIPSSEMNTPTSACLRSSHKVTPAVPTPIPALTLNPSSQPLQVRFEQSSFSAPNHGSHSISPPLTLSTLQYPFQTLDLYGPSFSHPSFEQPPPLTSSFPGMEYLNFPDTPGPPRSARREAPEVDGMTEIMAIASSGGGFSMDMVAEPKMGPVQVDAWDIFRTPMLAGGAGKVDRSELQAGLLKRKRGRPRCTFTTDRPLPSSSAPSEGSMPSPAAQVAREAEIRTQEALEAELKSAVDELNGRVRGILDRTTPEVVREAGVSDILDGPTGYWGVAKAIISRVIGPSPLQVATPLPSNRIEVDTPVPIKEATPVPPRAELTSPPPVALLSVYKGSWTPLEIARLKDIVASSFAILEGVNRVDWDLVVDTFGPTRTKHQILCKAVDLGLRGTTTAVSRRKRQKRNQQTTPSALSRSVSTSGEDGDAEDELGICTTATSVSSLS